jgi:hypothetical protein
MRIVASFWIYAGILEDLQHFSPHWQPSVADFAVSAPRGALRRAYGRLPGALRVEETLIRILSDLMRQWSRQ